MSVSLPWLMEIGAFELASSRRFSRGRHHAGKPEVQTTAKLALQPGLRLLMHGVGRTRADLFGLAPQVPGQSHVLSLRGPLSLGPASYAWFTFAVGPDGGRTMAKAG
jgi:phospholipase/carboxylesterase